MCSFWGNGPTAVFFYLKRLWTWTTSRICVPGPANFFFVNHSCMPDLKRAEAMPCIPAWTRPSPLKSGSISWRWPQVSSALDWIFSTRRGIETDFGLQNKRNDKNWGKRRFLIQKRKKERKKQVQVALQLRAASQKNKKKRKALLCFKFTPSQLFAYMSSQVHNFLMFYK